MFAAVVFDCDGVLVDSERLNNEVFAELATRAGVPTTFAESVARYMGRSTAESLADLERALGRPVDFAFEEEYVRLVTERQGGGLLPVPGVVALLDALDAAGVARCVASSGTPAEIEFRLAVTGLDEYFGNHVYSASMVSRGKPAPDLFLHAAAGLGVPPGTCALVEDSPYGVAGGVAAGMTVIGYAALASAGELREAGAAQVVRDLTEVPALLGLPI